MTERERRWGRGSGELEAGGSRVERACGADRERAEAESRVEREGGGGITGQESELL